MTIPKEIIAIIKDSISSELNAASYKIILTIVVIYVVGYSLDKIITYFIEQKKNKTAEYAKIAFQQRYDCGKLVFKEVYKTLPKATLTPRELTLTEDIKPLRDLATNMKFILSADEHSKLTEIIDHFEDAMFGNRISIEGINTLCDGLKQSLKQLD